MYMNASKHSEHHQPSDGEKTADHANGGSIVIQRMHEVRNGEQKRHNISKYFMAVRNCINIFVLYVLEVRLC